MINPSDTKKYIKKRQGYKYLLSFFVTSLIVFILFQIFLENMVVDGNSMSPTLLDGDIGICVKSTFATAEKGDIVNIKSSYLGENIVKRVIATEGDSVTIKNGIVYVNNNQEYYSSQRTKGDVSLTVPKGQIFVLGDNRGDSTDSRIIGCISIAEVNSILLFHFRL
jgi:signal peptidase I